MRLRLPAGQRAMRLEPPAQYLVVPTHTARVGTETTMLFITPGEGTENRETPGK